MCRYPVGEFNIYVLRETNGVTQQTSLGLLSIAGSAKRSSTGAIVLAVALFSIITNGFAAPSASPSAAPTAGPGIYKLVDASGRITYTNSPTKGANKVELDPITVIPSSPAGMLGGGQAGAPANVSTASGAARSIAAPELIPVGIVPTIAKPEAPTMPFVPIMSSSTQPTFAASARAPLVQPATAVVTPVSANLMPRVPPIPARLADQTGERVVAQKVEAPALSANKLPVVKLSPRDVAPSDVGIRSVAVTPSVPTIIPSAPAQATAAPMSPVTLAVASIRDLDLPLVAQPSLQANLAAPKFEKEEQLLATLKAQLAEQQNASASFRALRARMPTPIDQNDSENAAIQNDIKARVDQHFARIRSLQDQIAQREQSLAMLRQ